jgi:beta-carotene 3-hydroxylase
MVLNVLIIIAGFYGVWNLWLGLPINTLCMAGMWHFHKDHHDHSNESFFEKNDIFFLIFAIAKLVRNYVWCVCNGFDFKFYIGIGVLFYGSCLFY